MYTEELNTHFEQKLSIHLGESATILKCTPIAGGCINNSQRLETDKGVYFLKLNKAAAFPGMFEVEAKGLNLLLRAGNINISKPIFYGVEGGVQYLVLEYVEGGTQHENFWQDFGQALAALHKNSQQHFGLDHDNYIGSLRQHNTQHVDWTSFFIEERLQKQLELAVDCGKAGQELLKSFSRFYKRVPEIFPTEQPALLHGDLWSGNFMCNHLGKACIYDPAVYYGHREMELAFTQLFGGFSSTFYQSYHENFPLEVGFSSRVDYYNLYPLMVHVNLFGGGYINSVRSILKAF